MEGIQSSLLFTWVWLISILQKSLCFTQSILSFYRGLCDNDYHDEVCRANYSKRAYNPPLLYNLHHDPGEIYLLNSKNTPEYNDVLNTITKVRIQVDRIIIFKSY